MAKSFKTLKHKLSEAAQKKASDKTIILLKEMHLQELRQSRYLSQERIAEILKTKQANISRLEQRSDMHVSTLRTYIEAMGGKLDIVAIFPEGEVHINQFNS
jgi:DNA-binding transcriptional regulator YiaG